MMLFTYLIWASLSASIPQMTEQSAIDLATKTLAQELRVEEQDLEVVRTVPMQWPNSSLGCPGRGQSYLQVIIPGYRVDFKSGTRIYRVHVGDGRAVLCKGVNKLARTSAEKPGLTGTSRLSQLAKEDLAARLDVDKDEIRVEFIEPMTWHDTSMGCPEEGKTYKKVSKEGYVIGLIHQGVTYEYHTDQKKPVLCKDRYTR